MKQLICLYAGIKSVMDFLLSALSALSVYKDTASYSTLPQSVDVTILDLPVEIICSIVSHLNNAQVLRFMTTCDQFSVIPFSNLDIAKRCGRVYRKSIEHIRKHILNQRCGHPQCVNYLLRRLTEITLKEYPNDSLRLSEEYAIQLKYSAYVKSMHFMVLILEYASEYNVVQEVFTLHGHDIFDTIIERCDTTITSMFLEYAGEHELLPVLFESRYNGPLTHAAGRGDLPMVKMLLSVAATCDMDMALLRNKSCEALRWSIQMCKRDVVEYLQNYGPGTVICNYKTLERSRETEAAMCKIVERRREAQVAMRKIMADA